MKNYKGFIRNLVRKVEKISSVNFCIWIIW